MEYENYISLRWVKTCKYVDSNKQIESRLVASDFEEGNSSVLTDSPTCYKGSLRFTFTLCSTKSWKIHFLHISTAFLQGKSIDWEAYVKPPSEADFDIRIIYGNLQCVFMGLVMPPDNDT